MSDTATAWTRATGCSAGGQCVEVRVHPDGVEVRDSKNPDVALRFTAAEWGVFTAGVRGGEFDTVLGNGALGRLHAWRAFATANRPGYDHLADVSYEDAPIGDADLDEALRQLADYENRITWHTTCQQCANDLDRLYAEHVRAETAETERDELRAEIEQMAPPACPTGVHAGWSVVEPGYLTICPWCQNERLHAEVDQLTRELGEARLIARILNRRDANLHLEYEIHFGMGLVPDWLTAEPLQRGQGTAHGAGPTTDNTKD